MGKIPKKTLHQRRYIDGKYAQEKMLSIVSLKNFKLKQKNKIPLDND